MMKFNDDKKHRIYLHMILTYYVKHVFVPQKTIDQIIIILNTDGNNDMLCLVYEDLETWEKDLAKLDDYFAVKKEEAFFK